MRRPSPDAPCHLRIFEGTIDARLLALDGRDRQTLRRISATPATWISRRASVYRKYPRGDYQVTSAPAVVGGRGDHRIVDRRQRRRGHAAVAWCAVTMPAQASCAGPGIQFPGPASRRCAPAPPMPGRLSPPIQQRGLVFIPTGSASPDYYGGERPGDNRWANSVVALKASTGEFVWGFQVVHHDLWDYDVASQPALIDFQRQARGRRDHQDGQCVRARSRDRQAASHRGGARRPQERHARRGCRAQPAGSQRGARWSRRKLTAADAWGPTPEARKWCQEQIAIISQRRPVHAAQLTRGPSRFPAMSAESTGAAPPGIPCAISCWPTPIVWLRWRN